MPIFHYTCPVCEIKIRRILKPSETKGQTCLMCGGLLSRTPVGPSTQTKEVIDSGTSCRRVERLVDIEELMHNRAQEDMKPKRRR